MTASSHATAQPTASPALCTTCQQQTSPKCCTLESSPSLSANSNAKSPSHTTTHKRPKLSLATGPAENSHPNNSQVIVLVEDKQNLLHVPPTFATQDPPDIFTQLSAQQADWCRYCGTTHGVNWRPGPWGKKTLCNRHGCDFKGYGFAAHKPKLDLSAFYDETLEDRKIPVIKEFCMHCQSKVSLEAKPLRMCHGCPRSFHPLCYQEALNDPLATLGTGPSEEWNPGKPWFCSGECERNFTSGAVLVELPKKGLPYSLGSKSSSPGNSPKPGVKNHSTRGSSGANRKHSSSASKDSSMSSRHCEGNFFYDSEFIARLTRSSIGGPSGLLASSYNNLSIEIPKWTLYPIQPSCEALAEDIEAMEDVVVAEQTEDEIYIARHLAYEQLEKGNKLMFNAPVNNAQ